MIMKAASDGNQMLKILGTQLEADTFSTCTFGDKDLLTSAFRLPNVFSYNQFHTHIYDVYFSLMLIDEHKNNSVVVDVMKDVLDVAANDPSRFAYEIIGDYNPFDDIVLNLLSDGVVNRVNVLLTELNKGSVASSYESTQSACTPYSIYDSYVYSNKSQCESDFKYIYLTKENMTEMLFEKTCIVYKEINFNISNRYDDVSCTLEKYTTIGYAIEALFSKLANYEQENRALIERLKAELDK